MGEDDHGFHTWLFVIWSNFGFINILVCFRFHGQDSMGPYAHIGVVGDRRGWPWVLGWFHIWLYVIWSNFCFTNTLVCCLFHGQDCRSPYAHLGVVVDRRGWPWVLGLYHTWLYVIWSNFCFTNILVCCLFHGQDSRGPYAPLGVVNDRRGWPGWPNMVPIIIICHLEQFLFSKHCSERLYLEIAVKFSSQEHRRPPRIQEEKSGFDSRNPKSGYDLIWKCLLT